MQAAQGLRMIAGVRASRGGEEEVEEEEAVLVVVSVKFMVFRRRMS